MLKSLIPWRKENSNIAVRHDEPTRAQDYEDYSLARFRDEFDSLLQKFFSNSWPSNSWPSNSWPSNSWPSNSWPSDRWLSNLPSMWDAPRMDWNWDMGWEDKDKEYVFHAELPGFKPEDLDVKVSENVLTVRAEHRDEKQGERGATYHYGSFARSLTLPHGADQQQIDARYHSGVLEVHVPKTDEVHGKRIEVSSA